MIDDENYEPLLPRETTPDASPHPTSRSRGQRQVAILLLVYFAETVIATYKLPFLPRYR